MGTDDRKIDPDGARTRLEETVQLAAVGDAAVIEHANQVIQELRTLRVQNHWADKVALRFRGA